MTAKSVPRAFGAAASRAFRWLRVWLPERWSIMLGELPYLPRLVRGPAFPRAMFAEESMIERLSSGREPLEGIGAGFSERVVEIPWVLRRIPPAPRKHILDVGTVFSVFAYKRLLVRQPHLIDAVDLASGYVPSMKTHVADVRELPFDEDSFDVAICISTLEHVGMDNRVYGVASGGGGDVTALRELGRVARRVFVTVPAGSDADLGWQRQYALRTFRRTVEEAGLVVESLEVFAHDPAGGWAPTREDSVLDRTYGEGASCAAAIICAELGRLPHASKERDSPSLAAVGGRPVSGGKHAGRGEPFRGRGR